MTSKPNNIEMNNRKELFFKQIIVYTVLFLITAVGVYFTFIYFNRTFLRDSEGNIDGIAQMYPVYFSLKQMISDIFAGNGFDFWSWEIGLGEDAFTTYLGKLLNPLTYIVLAFPEKYLDVGIDVMIITAQYLSGLMFMIFGKSVSMDRFQCAAGALCYSFSGWILFTVVRQGPFLIATVLLPLIILGAEKILKKQCPVLFIISVSLHLCCSVLWSYVAAITVILYFLVRYFHYYPKQNISCFLKKTCAFIGYGFIGIMIAAIAVIQSFVKLGGATTESTVEYGMLYPLIYYLKLPTRLFELSDSFTLYSVIALPVICIMLIPVIITNIRKKNTASIITVLFLVVSLFPVTGSIFNGLSYSVGRWFYVISFFMVWASMEAMNKETFTSRKKIMTMSLWLIALGIWNIVVCYGILNITDINSVLATIIGLLFGIVILGCICFARKGKLRGIFAKSGNHKTVRTVIILCIVLNIVGYANMLYFPWVSDYIYKVAPQGRIENKLNSSTQRVVPQLQEGDKSFFRSDQVDGYSDTRVARVRANENIYFGNRSIYTYFSSMSSKWHEFNKTMGNNAGYFDRTTSYSNDNRVGLDFLMGVKYFLGDSETKKPGASQYAPYGFEYSDVIDGVEVLKNKYCMGLGTLYEKYITESELMEYSYLEREQIMMQAAVVPDEYDGELDGILHASKSELITDIREIDYTIVNKKDIDIGLNGEAAVYGRGGTFEIQIPRVEGCQIVISFKNLVREKCDYHRMLELTGTFDTDNEGAVNRLMNELSFEDDEKFQIMVSKGAIEKAALNRKGKNQGFSDVVDYNINLGYFDSIEGNIKITIDRLGDYTFDELQVYAVPMEIYNENALKLEENKINITSFDNDCIEGTIEASDDSIMYLSILNTNGWNIYIDGKKVEKINDVNISFTGTEVKKGSHIIKMKYESPGLKTGIIVSIIGIAAMAVCAVFYKRKGNRENRNK